MSEIAGGYCNFVTFVTTLHCAHNLKERFNLFLTRQFSPLWQIIWKKIKLFILGLNLVFHLEVYLTPVWWLLTQQSPKPVAHKWKQVETSGNKWKQSFKWCFLYVFTYLYKTKLNSSHHHGSSVCWIWIWYKGIYHVSNVFGHIGKQIILIPVCIQLSLNSCLESVGHPLVESLSNKLEQLL